MLENLYNKYDAKKITIQSGGSMNERFVRDNLIDFVNIVIAPILISGKDVPTLVDEVSISSDDELDKLRALELIKCNKLDNSYIQLKYKIRK